MSQKQPRHNSPTISVVVLTANRSQLLRQCLASLEVQTVKPIEIIIVDGSKDPQQIPGVIQKISMRIPLRIIRDNKKSIPFARDMGARRTQGDLIAYLDDDLTADNTYLARMRGHFLKTPHLTAVMGRIKNAIPDNLYAATQYAYYNRGLRQHFRSMQVASALNAGRMLDAEVLCIRGNHLIRSPFRWPRPAHFRNDDVELGLQLMQSGASVIFDPAIIAWASPRNALLPLWITAFWNGYSDGYTENHYQVNLRASPYPSMFLPWFWKEIQSRKTFSVLKKIWYALLLISFPSISRMGKLWYRTKNIL